MTQAGHECVGFCEFDKYAVASYTSMYLITDEQRKYLATLDLKKRQKEILKEEYRNGIWYSNDIRTVKGANVPQADIWCFGSPCFVAGNLVTTSEGVKPIEEIKAGDMVLTHKNHFRKVVTPMVHKAKGICTLKVQGSLPTDCTANHRFYVRYKNYVWNNSKRGYDSVWTEPEWKAIGDFTGKEFILFPKNTVSENSRNLSPIELWLLGRYVADGYIQDYERKDRPSNIQRVVWCIGNEKLLEFESKIKESGIKYYSDSSFKSCTKILTTNKKFFELVQHFGRGAKNKYIPSFIMNLSKEDLKYFLDGYIAGDGCHIKNAIKLTTTSKNLLYQLGQCVFKIYEVPYSISVPKVQPVTHIEGRKVNQSQWYALTFRTEIKKQNNGKVIDGNLWMPVKEISFDPDREEDVYNMEVEEDHAYTINNMGCHNCQSFSLAGKRAGLEGESGLIREVFRILGEIEESSRPEWLIYENVKGMFSSNRGFDFLAILLEMDSLGYDVEWELFNSKWYVPQNRERVYTVGHLRRYGPTKIFPIFPTNEKDNIPEREQNEEKEGSGISLIGHREGFHRNLQTYSSNGITETLDTSGGGGREFNVAIPVETDKVTEIYNEYNQSTSTEYVGSLGTDQQSPRKPGGFRVIESIDKDAICPASFIDMDTQAELTDTARCLMARYDKGVNYKLRETSGVCYPLSVSDEIDVKKT